MIALLLAKGLEYSRLERIVVLALSGVRISYRVVHQMLLYTLLLEF